LAVGHRAVDATEAVVASAAVVLVWIAHVGVAVGVLAVLTPIVAWAIAQVVTSNGSTAIFAFGGVVI
jgi:hypothetical protein